MRDPGDGDLEILSAHAEDPGADGAHEWDPGVHGVHAGDPGTDGFHVEDPGAHGAHAEDPKADGAHAGDHGLREVHVVRARGARRRLSPQFCNHHGIRWVRARR